MNELVELAKTSREKLLELWHAVKNLGMKLLGSKLGFRGAEGLSVTWEALLPAVKYFDVSRGVKFSTYYAYWVKACALRYKTKLRKLYTGVKLGQAWLYSEDLLYRAGGASGGAESDWESDGNGASGIDECDVEDEADSLKKMRLVLDAMERIPEKQKHVLQEMLLGKRGFEVAAEMGVSRQRVDQIRDAAVERVKELTNSKQ